GLSAASAARPPGRAASGHRRLRRRGAHHGSSRLACRDPRVEPRFVGLRAASVALRRARVRPQGRVVRGARSGAPALNTLNRALAMLALAALVLGLLGAAVILGSDYEDHRGLVAALTLAIGASWIGTGLYVWWRRPENRFGALMTWVGFAWLLHAFVSANDDVAFTVAILFSHLYLAAFLHLLLSYPDGRVTNPSRRRLMWFGYVLSILGPLPALMFGFNEQRDGCCPPSAFQISGN